MASMHIGTPLANLLIVDTLRHFEQVAAAIVEFL